MSPAALSGSALRDLVAAASRISADRPSAALRFRASIYSLGQRIGEFPESGARRTDLVSNDRYRFFDLAGFPYLLVVNIAERPPLILRILHTSRDIQALLGD